MSALKSLLGVVQKYLETNHVYVLRKVCQHFMSVLVTGVSFGT